MKHAGLTTTSNRFLSKKAVLHIKYHLEIGIFQVVKNINGLDDFS